MSKVAQLALALLEGVARHGRRRVKPGCPLGRRSCRYGEQSSSGFRSRLAHPPAYLPSLAMTGTDCCQAHREPSRSCHFFLTCHQRGWPKLSSPAGHLFPVPVGPSLDVLLQRQPLLAGVSQGAAAGVARCPLPVGTRASTGGWCCKSHRVSGFGMCGQACRERPSSL